MTQTSEYVSPGHPDKVADGIVAFLLDRYIEKDERTRFALECQIKDNFVTLGGEVTSTANFTNAEITDFVRRAVREVGYTEEYADRWGRSNCIDPSLLDVTVHISQQSPDIAQGVDADGWGDQGIFWGLATNNAVVDYQPTDHALARSLGQTLYCAAREGSLDIGLDIKTQVTLVDGRVRQVIVAAPIHGTAEHIRDVQTVVKHTVIDECSCDSESEIIINGTGSYVRHASQGDCGTTGRKLAVDFYGGNCRIGGGCPWGKDPSKADVALNIYARHKAVAKLRESGFGSVFCAISCCIGRRDIRVAYLDEHLNEIATETEERPSSDIIREMGLYAPVYAFKNAHGLFSLPQKMKRRNYRKTTRLPPCRHRRNVRGVEMCYAIGCCEVGDMPCECHGCTRPCRKRHD